MQPIMLQSECTHKKQDTIFNIQNKTSVLERVIQCLKLQFKICYSFLRDTIILSYADSNKYGLYAETFFVVTLGKGWLFLHQGIINAFTKSFLMHHSKEFQIVTNKKQGHSTVYTSSAFFLQYLRFRLSMVICNNTNTIYNSV